MENKFDKEIEDLGWEKMQTLLDKEKPVVGFIPPQYIDPKSGKNGSMRKRWALMALLFLSLIGGGVWSYYFFKIKSENQSAIVLNNASAIENNEQNLTQNKSSEMTNEVRKAIQNEAQQKVENSDLTKRSNFKNLILEKYNKPDNLNVEKENKIQNIDNQLIVKNIDSELVTMDVDFDKKIKDNLNQNNESIMDKKLTNGLNILNAENVAEKTQNNEDKFVHSN